MTHQERYAERYRKMCLPVSHEPEDLEKRVGRIRKLIGRGEELGNPPERLAPIQPAARTAMSCWPYYLCEIPERERGRKPAERRTQGDRSLGPWYRYDAGDIIQVMPTYSRNKRDLKPASVISYDPVEHVLCLSWGNRRPDDCISSDSFWKWDDIYGCWVADGWLAIDVLPAPPK